MLNDDAHSVHGNYYATKAHDRTISGVYLLAFFPNVLCSLSLSVFLVLIFSFSLGWMLTLIMYRRIDLYSSPSFILYWTQNKNQHFLPRIRGRAKAVVKTQRWPCSLRAQVCWDSLHSLSNIYSFFSPYIHLLSWVKPRNRVECRRRRPCTCTVCARPKLWNRYPPEALCASHKVA